ncbi:hypothetical protein CAEBREN_24392 [Caenorhabditis brenneri]|uniref:T20D4.11-like domain-containing protein n=1 Tax=Caenorhabditis brenneri TaxID=135651 RepID=G0M9U5_CAEBE|nr:hypothetical protein CAEBREN_24392 [Caenorhabditis brenneri]
MPNVLFQTFILSVFLTYFCLPVPLKATTLTSCDGPIEEAKAEKCDPLMREFTNRSIGLAFLDLKINDTRLLSMRELCKDLKTCMNSTCYYGESRKKEVRIACDGIAIRNTYFMECLNKIKTGTVDLSKYTCMDSLDKPVQMYTTKKWCTKIMFREVCGEKSLNNFDRHCRIMVRIFGLVDKAGFG